MSSFNTRQVALFNKLISLSPVGQEQDVAKGIHKLKDGQITSGIKSLAQARLKAAADLPVEVFRAAGGSIAALMSIRDSQKRNFSLQLSAAGALSTVTDLVNVISPEIGTQVLKDYKPIEHVLKQQCPGNGVYWGEDEKRWVSLLDKMRGLNSTRDHS